MNSTNELPLVVIVDRQQREYQARLARFPFVLLLPTLAEDTNAIAGARVGFLHDGNPASDLEIAHGTFPAPLFVFGGGISSSRAFRDGTLLKIPREVFEARIMDFLETYVRSQGVDIDVDMFF